jgi:hypothetical protein
MSPKKLCVKLVLHIYNYLKRMWWIVYVFICLFCQDGEVCSILGRNKGAHTCACIGVDGAWKRSMDVTGLGASRMNNVLCSLHPNFSHKSYLKMTSLQLRVLALTRDMMPHSGLMWGPWNQIFLPCARCSESYAAFTIPGAE